jgi:nucleoside diphosphate kinase
MGQIFRRILLTILDMASGPICAMVWEGRDAVKTGRGMTNYYSENHLLRKLTDDI